MAKVSIQLSFQDQTEEAFTFYKNVFGTEFSWPLSRMGDAPIDPAYPLSEAEKQLIMHVALPILNDFTLMGSDTPQSRGITIRPGNNIHITLEPDTRTETDRLFAALSAGGIVDMPLQDMFWGDYFGSCIDKYGISWVFNCQSKV